MPEPPNKARAFRSSFHFPKLDPAVQMQDAQVWEGAAAPLPVKEANFHRLRPECDNVFENIGQQHGVELAWAFGCETRIHLE